MPYSVPVGDNAAPTGERIAGFDGLRAFAVLLVMASHVWLAVPELLGHSWYRVFPRGGFLGVNVFFVLSGFLITYRFLETRNARFTSSLRNFAAKRFMRIMPLTLLFLSLNLAYVLLWGVPDTYTMGNVWTGIISTIGQYANYAIYNDPRVLSDNVAIWSLSIEGQFYFFAPFFLFLVVRGRRSLVPVVVTTVLFVVLVLNAARLYDASGWFAAYIRTESRFSSLVLGMLGALWFRPKPDRGRRILGPASLVAAACIIGIIGWARANGGFVWFGGMALFDLATLVVVLSAAAAVCPFSRLLDLRPIRWIGQISFGLYMWQLPVFRLIGRHGMGLSSTSRLVLAVGLTFALSTLSWSFFEKPLLRSRFSRWLAGGRTVTASSH